MSYMGASEQASAARDAASSQAAAAKYATDIQKQMYEEGRSDLAPARLTGGQALNSLAALMGLPGVAPTKAAYTSADGTLDQAGYDKALAAYQQGQGSAQFGSLTKPFTFSTTGSNADPSYQWRFQQGEDAVNASAAAKGGYFSGQTGLDLTKYGQGMASTEYQNEFDRWLTENQTTFNELSGLAGTGQTAATATAQLGANTGTGIANTTMTGANNAAAYNLNAAQATASGYQGIANQYNAGAGSYLNYNQNQNLLALLNKH